MKYDIDSILNSIKALESNTDSLDSIFRSSTGKWDDEVKESYRKLNWQCRHNLDSIRINGSIMKATLEEMAFINVDAIINSVDAIIDPVYQKYHAYAKDYDI